MNTNSDEKKTVAHEVSIEEVAEQASLPDTPHSLSHLYAFQKEIGHGAQGRIFQAIRLSDQSQVVIKQLNIHSITTWKEYDLFHREAQVLQKLNLQGVAKFYDAIDCLEDDPPCSYIIQELIHGKTLQQMLNESHRFTLEEIYDILIQTLRILDELHSQRPPIIHRDIKPSNIMISPSFLFSIVSFPKCTRIRFKVFHSHFH